jgi:DNA recombination protein RmuC
MTALLAAAAAAALFSLLARARLRELHARLESRDTELLRAGEELARTREESAAALRAAREEQARLLDAQLDRQARELAALRLSHAASEEAARSSSARQLAAALEETARGREQITSAESARARLQAELESSADKLKLLEDAQQKIQATFAVISKQALDSNSAHVMQLAEQVLARAQESSRAESDKRSQAVAEMVKPVHESLHRVDAKIQQLETSNAGAAERLAEQVRSLTASEEKLRGETARLATALRAPAQRGRWGEHQLRRTIELAGLRRYVDFDEQPVSASGEGVLRPDMAVRLPGGKTVLIDSKVPFEAYQRAIEAAEADREPLLRAHALQLRAHVEALAKKQYWEAFEGSPEMVVLFVPTEGLLAAALDVDPTLDADAFRSRVVLASPSTLLSVLLTVAHVWKQESIAIHAREIAHHGRELHKRIAKLADHLAKLGRALGTALGSYNDVVSSFESRLLPGARKFEELKAAASDVEIAPLPEIDGQPSLPLLEPLVPEEAN